MDLGVDEGEITFPAVSSAVDDALCFVSETISEAPCLTPSMAEALQRTLQSFREIMQGRSIRYQANGVDLLEGDSGDFLTAWGQIPVLAM